MTSKEIQRFRKIMHKLMVDDHDLQRRINDLGTDGFLFMSDLIAFYVDSTL